MSIFFENLQFGLKAMGISLEAATLLKLERHWQLVCEYNQKFNLTAIHDDAQAAHKHYVDCLLPLPRLHDLAQREQQKGRVLKAADIGSGAGFPGLVLALACPHSEWLLLEAGGKKCRFLQLCLKELSISNVRALPLRAEQAGREAGLREQYHLVMARAVAPLSVLAEYALPLLALGGQFAALKGPALAEEEEAAAKALAVLGACRGERQEFTLPGGETRYIAWYEKIAPIAEKYPRRVGIPEKRPL